MTTTLSGLPLSFPINPFEAIDHARRTPELEDAALELYARSVYAALANKERAGNILRGSDAGGCVAAVWSTIRGYQVRPPLDDGTQDKLDTGNLMGLLYSCYLKMGFEDLVPSGVGTIEAVGSYGGVPFHADCALGVVLSDGILYQKQVVEQKWTAHFKAYDGAASYQALQACEQALGIGAEWATVCTWAPASRWKRELQHFRALEWVDDVQADIARLQPALEERMPEGDPQEDWRCRKCWSTACRRSTHFGRMAS